MRKRLTLLGIGLSALAVTACSGPAAVGKDTPFGAFSAGPFRFMAPTSLERVSVPAPAPAEPSSVAPVTVPAVEPAVASAAVPMTQEATTLATTKSKVCPGW